MSKKRKKSVPVSQPKQEKKMVINMNEINLKKQHITASFRTGKFMTEKDRPRKKDWKREYESIQKSFLHKVLFSYPSHNDMPLS